MLDTAATERGDSDVYGGKITLGLNVMSPYLQLGYETINYVEAKYHPASVMTWL